MNIDAYETLRKRYRPDEVRVLFVGESRPANGTFFYSGDSRLAKYTCEAFSHDDEPPEEVQSFLKKFQDNGCFLVDLCAHPVNHLSRQERRLARRAGESSLAATILETQPSAIVVVMSGIKESVARALSASVTTDCVHILPFPAQGHERQYVAKLRQVITSLEHQGLLERVR